MNKYTCDTIGGKDNQIRIQHPGPNKTWQCPQCELAEPINVKFNKNLLQEHPIRKCFLYCECGLTIYNTRSNGTLMRYCDSNRNTVENRNILYANFQQKVNQVRKLILLKSNLK